MLGERTIKKTLIAVSEEGAKQHELIEKEIDKLVNITEKGWVLIQSDLFDKVRAISCLEGAAAAMAGAVTTMVVTEVLKARKQKKAEQRLEEKGLL